jgi:hypothetical protein
MSGVSLDRALLEAKVEQDREDLKQALADLQASAKQAIDPRERIRARPRTWMLVAFVVGLCIGERN